MTAKWPTITSHIRATAFSPDEHTLAVGIYETVIIWDLTSISYLRRIQRS